MSRKDDTPVPVQETVELRISARPENLSLARLALAGVGATIGAPAEVIADLKVAVTEACTNAIKHAYRSGEEDGIVVSYSASGETISIRVEDRGVGFDPENPFRGGRLNGDSHGMGLMIIRALADELEVTSDSSGTRVVFLKHFVRES